MKQRTIRDCLPPAAAAFADKYPSEYLQLSGGRQNSKWSFGLLVARVSQMCMFACDLVLMGGAELRVWVKQNGIISGSLIENAHDTFPLGDPSQKYVTVELASDELSTLKIVKDEAGYLGYLYIKGCYRNIFSLDESSAIFKASGSGIDVQKYIQADAEMHGNLVSTLIGRELFEKDGVFLLRWWSNSQHRYIRKPKLRDVKDFKMDKETADRLVVYLVELSL